MEESPTQFETLTARDYLRLLLFVLMAAFIIFGPFYRQVLGGKSRIFREWVMFRGYGRQICDVKFVARQSPGQEQPIKRLATLGYENWWQTPISVRRLKTLNDAVRQGRKICKLIDPPAAVHMSARCGTRRGWVQRSKGTFDLCHPRELQSDLEKMREQ